MCVCVRALLGHRLSLLDMLCRRSHSSSSSSSNEDDPASAAAVASAPPDSLPSFCMQQLQANMRAPHRQPPLHGKIMGAVSAAWLSAAAARDLHLGCGGVGV